MGAVVLELGDHAFHELCGVELRLIGQANTAVVGEGSVGCGLPPDGQPGLQTSIPFIPSAGGALTGLRIGVGILGLCRYAVFLAIAQQPVAPLCVARGVCACDGMAMPARDTR
ncbi:Uncharacterised protein [Mycobacteroides abscessus]|nr:Uncharacterised protein [Mycobacteroides abscessus]